MGRSFNKSSATQGVGRTALFIGEHRAGFLIVGRYFYGIKTPITPGIMIDYSVRLQGCQREHSTRRELSQERHCPKYVETPLVTGSDTMLRHPL